MVNHVMIKCCVGWVVSGHVIAACSRPPTTCRKTRDIEPVLGYCWASVEDGGPTLNQHWLSVSCLLGCHLEYTNSDNTELSKNKRNLLMYNNITIMSTTVLGHINMRVHIGPGNYGLFPFHFSPIFWPHYSLLIREK